MREKMCILGHVQVYICLDLECIEFVFMFFKLTGSILSELYILFSYYKFLSTLKVESYAKSDY